MVIAFAAAPKIRGGRWKACPGREQACSLRHHHNQGETAVDEQRTRGSVQPCKLPPGLGKAVARHKPSSDGCEETSVVVSCGVRGRPCYTARRTALLRTSMSCTRLQHMSRIVIVGSVVAGRAVFTLLHHAPRSRVMCTGERLLAKPTGWVHAAIRALDSRRHLVGMGLC